MDIDDDISVIRVGLVLIDDFPLMAYASAIEPLRAANLLSNQPRYQIRHIADAYLGEHVDFDLVLVIAGGNVADTHDRRLTAWLRLLAGRGVLVGGVSGGPLLLARAGVLNGYRATIHWDHAELLITERNDVIVEQSLYVRDRRRLTCAGGTAALDMMHSLILEQCGAQLAQIVSDWFLKTEVRYPEGPQRSGIAERYGTNNEVALKALESMENHIADPLELDQLAILSGISARQLTRVFATQLKCSPVVFYRQMRLKKVHQLLLSSSMTLQTIATTTGFANAAHMSKRFKESYGESPQSLRKKAGS